jgi:CHAT domain-containing protein
MTATIKRRLLVGLILLFSSWGVPHSADLSLDRPARELRMELPARADNTGEARNLLPLLKANKTIGYGGIQRDLGNETILLEYVLGEPKSLLWAVTSSSVGLFDLPPQSVIDPLAIDFRDSLIQSRQPAPRARAELAANRLSAILLSPVAEQLTAKRRVVIVLDGSLKGIPFAALPNPLDSREYLLTRHEIVELPSASILTALRQRKASRPPPSKLLAILADPVFDEHDPRLAHRQEHVTASPTASENVRDANSPFGLRRLPYSRQEAQAILALLPKGDTLAAFDFEASREQAVNPDLGQYRYLHFATHGIQDGSSPDRSGIALSQFGRDGQRREGFLDVQAIRSLDLSADLVVLSACSTALSRETDDTISLSQGFLEAGAQRVVASLWEVSDKATAKLMSRFYHGLFQQRLPPAAALRQAQLEMMRDARWDSPFYWAGFVLEGDWR